ncbi:MAG: haloacid dehalogenase-like hydrolase [Hyphomicrobiaceae bacterium]|nr:haloacid dehalogenase-like hydrolase [Hyphomicrobiaceae bacterium]
MRYRLRAGLTATAVAGFLLLASAANAQVADPLPSWNEGPAKQAITSFVARVVQPGPDYVAPADRIAVFDNDGTLWAEQPVYFQAFFAIDRAKGLVARDPKLAALAAVKAAADDDLQALSALGEHGIAELVALTHSGMTPEAFIAEARRWLASARHPRLDRLFTDLTYQPQLELLGFLRANGFKTFIVSGGGIDFVRAFSESAYGIPPEQVIGSSSKTRFELEGGAARLIKLAEIGAIDDREGKPVNINLHIGRRPVLAVGNSDGDLAMLQYTASGQGPRLMVLIHHDDAEREYAYDRNSRVGRLDAALDEAEERGWTVVSIKRDWRVVFRAN